MDHGTHHAATPASSNPACITDEFDNVLERRHLFKIRHASGLTRLMEQRDDLRGVHALADLVDDAIRWTA